MFLLRSHVVEQTFGLLKSAPLDRDLSFFSILSQKLKGKGFFKFCEKNSYNYNKQLESTFRRFVTSSSYQVKIENSLLELYSK